jgi:large subunit ribosomal protein L30
MTSRLRVRQKVSTIGRTEHMRQVILGLGLRGPGSEVVVANTPSFRGMVKKVIHLVEVEEVAGDATPSARTSE